jgi:MoaA/NifB/PqqE/SkfB family radical SAM enzyme
VTPAEIQILQFEPTSYCNARCPHCGRFDDVGNLHPDLTLSHLDIDTVLENLQLSSLTSLSQVILEGDKGDPIMHPKIEKFIDTFYKLPSCPVINLMTNGGIRSTVWWKNLGQQYPNLRVLFSIDGLEDTNHFYRVGVNYNKAMDNARAFIEGGGYAIWKFLIFKHNEHQIDQVISLSKEFRFSALHYGPGDRYRFQGLEKWPVRVNGEISYYIEPTSVNINQTQHINYRKYNLVKPPVYTNRICPNLSQGQIYINHLGHIVPCCMMHFDTENNYFGKDQMIQLTEGLDNQSLLCNTLSTVLNNKFFNNNLVESLLGPEETWHFNCQRSCKNPILVNKKNYDTSN